MLSFSNSLFPKKIVLALILSMVTFVTTASVELNTYRKMFMNGKFEDIVKALDLIKPENFTPKHYEIYVSSLLKIDLDDAEDAANQAIAKFTANADMYLLHANVMGEQAQDSIFSALSYAEKALNSLEKAAQLQPNNPKYLQGLMSFYLNAPSIAGGDTEIALELAKKISALDELRGISAFTNYYRAIDEKEKAYTNIKVGIQKFPNEIELHSQLASLYVRDDKFENAIEAYLDTVSITVNEPTQEALLQEEIKNKYERDLYTLYNSHYQIGRVALEANIQLESGIENLDKYIALYEASTIDLAGLPSSDWAYLRKSGLLLANNKPLEADATLKMIKVQESERMEKIYKKLKKQTKRAIKRSS